MIVAAVGYVAGTDQAPVLLAHHALVLALPFVLPVFLVVGMVAVVAWRDRHRTDEPDLEITDAARDGEGT
jgi:hypothetical protein